MVFDKFVQDIKNMPVVPPILVDMDISNDPSYSMDAFKRKILHNSDIPDEELYAFVKAQYKSILRSIFDMQDPAYLKFIVNHKFIMALTSVLGQVKIDDDIRTYCNKLVYDYITFDGMQKDIGDLMISLSRSVNREMIMLLKGIGLTDDLATFLAIAARSSETDTINIRRTNFFIATSVSDMWENLDDEDAMLQAEQLIINIYQKLFNKLTILFEATMFDVYDTNAPWMTEKISIMYSLTSMAVLRILNSFPYSDIRTVLVNYSIDYSVLSQNGKQPRFRLVSVSADFGRILQVIDVLRTENIYVP